jgi:hypothetical protein
VVVVQELLLQETLLVQRAAWLTVAAALAALALSER